MFDRICSCIGINKRDSITDTFIADVSLLSIGVLKEYRGKNIGVSEKLLREFERNASDTVLKFKTINDKICFKLSAKSNNIVARRFYEKCGYNILMKSTKEVTYIKNLLY